MQEKGEERPCWKDRQFWLRVMLLLALGYVFCSYFNDTFFDGDYKILPVRQAYMMALGALFLYFCAKARYIGICLYTPVCLLFVFLKYAKDAYGCELSEALVRAVIETNPEETAGFVSVESVTAVLISIVVCGALYAGAALGSAFMGKKEKGGRHRTGLVEKRHLPQPGSLACLFCHLRASSTGLPVSSCIRQALFPQCFHCAAQATIPVGADCGV